VGCWAHTWCKFNEALIALPPDKREGYTALTSLQYCNNLFAWEKKFVGLFRKEWHQQRLEKKNPS
jgi:hypothetical protein